MGRQAALQQLIATVQRRWGTRALRRLGEDVPPAVAALPTLRREAKFDVGVATLPYHAEYYGAPQNTLADGPALWIGAGKKPADFGKALAEVEIDGSKGVAMSFRAWDGQLRQPLLLGDGAGVSAMAPADGVLHPKNNLDALGADAPEKLCKAR